MWWCGLPSHLYTIAEHSHHISVLLLLLFRFYDHCTSICQPTLATSCQHNHPEILKHRTTRPLTTAATLVLFLFTPLVIGPLVVVCSCYYCCHWSCFVNRGCPWDGLRGSLGASWPQTMPKARKSLLGKGSRMGGWCNQINYVPSLYCIPLPIFCISFAGVCQGTINARSSTFHSWCTLMHIHMHSCSWRLYCNKLHTDTNTTYGGQVCGTCQAFQSVVSCHAAPDFWICVNRYNA